MNFDIITQNAEFALLDDLAVSGAPDDFEGALQFNFSASGLQINKMDLALLIKHAFDGRSAKVYFCGDGDIFIVWSQEQPLTKIYLKNIICEHYGVDQELYGTYYELKDAAEAIKTLVEGKISTTLSEPDTRSEVKQRQFSRFMEAMHSNKHNSPEHDIVLPSNLNISNSRINSFKNALAMRSQRHAPEILVVEDQHFFNRLLFTIIGKKYKSYSAVNASKALDMYLSTAPDIVLLDIQLPDMDGHALCTTLKSLDKEAFVIMVTGNNDHENIQKAFQNGAKGYISKPYSAQKIIDAIEDYKIEHRMVA